MQPIYLYAAAGSLEPSDIVSAFPSNQNPLTAWDTYRVAMAFADGRRSAEVDPDVSMYWIAFLGEEQPAGWAEALAGVQWNLYQGLTQVVTGQSQTIHLEINQSSSVQIPALRYDGTPIDWADKTLRLVVTDYRKQVQTTLTDSAITRDVGSFTITIGEPLTAKRRTLRWRLLEVTGGNEIEILQGLFPVY